MLTLRRFSTYEGLLQLKSQWNHILEDNDNHSVFLTWEWIRSWWDAFKEDNELSILVGYDPGGKAVGIAPLMIRRRYFCKIPLRSMEFISTGNDVVPEYMNFIMRRSYEDEFSASFCRYLDEHRDEWDAVNLQDMGGDNRIVDYITLNVRGTYNYQIQNCGRCIYIKLPLTWDDYLKGVSRKSRYNISKKERDMLRSYKVQFSAHDTAEGLDGVMDKLFELHKKRMAAKNTDGASLSGEFWRFHKNVAREFCRNGWLLIGVLKADDNVVACQYAYCYGNVLYHYQSGIDPDYGRYSVGLISNAHMIKEAINRGMKEYDFLRGNEEYKSHFADRHRDGVRLRIWNNTPRGLISLAAISAEQFIMQVKKNINSLIG